MISKTGQRLRLTEHEHRILITALQDRATALERFIEATRQDNWKTLPTEARRDLDVTYALIAQVERGLKP